MKTVAWFFQDDTESALISQVQWLQKELGVSDQFFAKLLKVEERTFFRWKTKDGTLPQKAQNHLKEFWRVILHILSFLNFDLNRVHVMLDHRDDSRVKIETPFTPPWIGTSMRAYMETNGPASIQKVDLWVQALRFADSH